MGKIVIVLMIVLQTAWADLKALKSNCLSCHEAQQIPSHLIYKRYLLKYSTKERIEKVFFHYLKDPKKENSIMPREFFLKFPMKEKLSYNDVMLKKVIESYIDHFDIKKKLVLEE